MQLGRALPVGAACTFRLLGRAAPASLPALPPDVASFRGVSSFYNAARSFLVSEPIKPLYWRGGGGMWGELIITVL